MKPRIENIIATSKELIEQLGVEAEAALQAAVQIEQIKMWEDAFVVGEGYPSALEKIAMALDGDRGLNPGIRQFVGDIANSMQSDEG
jgi:hypothetical protein